MSGDTNQIALRYREESTFGTVATGGNYRDLRYTGEGLASRRNDELSPEIDTTGQYSQLIRLGASHGGNIDTYFSYGNLDDMLEAVLGGTWSSALSLTDTDISAASSDNSINDLGGNFPAFTPGMWVRVSGFTGNAANNGYARVVSRTGSKVVLNSADITLVDDAAGESVTVKNDGSIRNGTTRKSFTFEKYFSQQATGNEYQIYAGCVVGNIAFDLSAEQAIRANISQMPAYSFAGQSTAVSPGVDAAPTNEPMSASQHVASVREAGVEMLGQEEAQVINFGFNRQLRESKGVGHVGSVNIRPSRLLVEGQLNAYYDDGALHDKMIAGTDTNLDFRMADTAGNTVIFTFPRVRLRTGEALAGGVDQDLMINMGFQALKDLTDLYTVQIDRIAA